jgi:hypothetical protein
MMLGAYCQHNGSVRTCGPWHNATPLPSHGTWEGDLEGCAVFVVLVQLLVLSLAKQPATSSAGKQDTTSNLVRSTMACCLASTTQ